MYTALTIAGSDPSGGAGIQADIKTMTAHGVYAMSAVTALTAQNTMGVTGILEVPPEFLAAQLESVFSDIPPDGVKVGDVLEASRPAGSFVYDAAGDCAHVVGVAGGAGITSMLSMAKAAEEGSEPFTMTLFFCVQNAYEFLFKDVLDGMKSGRVKVVYVVENDAPEWAESGVFTRELLHRYVGEECTLFACGGDALYRHIARELAGRNITCNAVAPGFIETDMTDALSEKQRAAIGERIAAKRFGTAEEVAALVRFLASEGSGYITGQVICIDGGMSL